MTSACVDGNCFQVDETGRLQLRTGCGIACGTGGLHVKGVDNWPFDCDIQDRGGRLFCDTDDRLYGEPLPNAQQFTVSHADDTSAVLAGGDSLCFQDNADFDMRDWCRGARWNAQLGWRISFDPGPVNPANVHVEGFIDVNAGGFSSVGDFWRDNVRADDPRVTWRSSVPFLPFLPAGQINNVAIKVCIDNNGPANITVQSRRILADGMVISIVV